MASGIGYIYFSAQAVRKIWGLWREVPSLIYVLGGQLIGLGSRASQVCLECRIFLYCFPVCLLNVAGIYFEYFDRTDNQDDQAYVAQILLDQLIEQHDWVLPYLPKAAINIMGLCHFEGTRFQRDIERNGHLLFSFLFCWGGGGYFETSPYPHRSSIVAEYGRGVPISKGRFRQATSAPWWPSAYPAWRGVHFFRVLPKHRGRHCPKPSRPWHVVPRSCCHAFSTLFSGFDFGYFFVRCARATKREFPSFFSQPPNNQLDQILFVPLFAYSPVRGSNPLKGHGANLFHWCAIGFRSGNFTSLLLKSA